MAVGDFNRDGIPDLVTANGGLFQSPGNDVSVLLGNGDGTFRPAVNYTVGLNPTAVAVADLNGDGFLDIVTANGSFTAPGSVRVLLGNGDGTFRATVSYSTGSNPRAVVVADFNGDGIPDVATANLLSFFEPGSVSVLLGNGDGTFRSAVNYPTGPTPTRMVAADVNGDHIIDLVTLNKPTGSTSASVLLGNGDGSFRAPANISLGFFFGAADLALADLNGDGIPDLVTANTSISGVGSVSVFLGNGDGSFRPPTSYPAGPPASSVTVAHLNGDAFPDLVVANARLGTTPLIGNDPGSITVLRGNGDGSFQAPATFATGPAPAAVVVADFNGDSVLDLATANFDGSTVTVLLGQSDGSFQTTPTLATGPAPKALMMADFNGDGIPDLVTLNGRAFLDEPCSVSVLLGNADGSFQAAKNYPVGDGCLAMAVGDVNGDGILDLVTANSPTFGQGGVSVLFGKGDGSFRAPINFAVPFSPTAVALVDLNGDGILDLVLADRFNARVSVLLGNGNGTFGPPTYFPVGAAPTAVAVADLNGDGFLDLVTSNGPNGPGSVSVLLGNGDGTFRPPVNYAVGLGPRSLAVADVNGDGVLDLVTANFGAGTVSVLLGNGNGTFRAAAHFAAGSGPAFVTVGDFNNDGIADLAVTGVGGTRVLLGNGDGTYRSTPISYGSAGVALLAKDFNGDGRLDLAVALPDYDRVALLFNDGNWPAGPGSISGPRESFSARGGIVLMLRAATFADTWLPGAAAAPRWTPTESALLTADRVEHFFSTARAAERTLGLADRRAAAWVGAWDAWAGIVQLVSQGWVEAFGVGY